MNDKILQNIWNNLTSEGLTTSDFDTWKSNVMASENIQENIHGYLTKKGLTTSDLETWKNNTGLKKKDIIQQPLEEQVEIVEEPITEKTARQDLVDFLSKAQEPDEREAVTRTGAGVGLGIGIGVPTTISKPEFKIDETLKTKVLEDSNVQKALDKNIFSQEDIDKALKGDTKAIEQIKSVSKLTPQEIDDLVKEKRLDEVYTYEVSSDLTPENVLESDLNRMYGAQKLANIEGFPVKHFDGYLNEQGYKEEYLKFLREQTVDENGREYDYSGAYNPSLAAERVKMQYLNNFINNEVQRNIDAQRLQYQKENNGSLPELDNISISTSSGINLEQLSQYIQEEFPLMTAKLKEQDVKNQENYQKQANDPTGLIVNAPAARQGWRSLEDRIANFSASTYDFIGMDGVADEIRMSQAETELNRGDLFKYTYASGKKAVVDGVEYLVSEDGRVFNLDAKLEATSVLSPFQYKSIVNQVREKGVEDSSFSFSGLTTATAGVATDIVFQLAVQKGVLTTGSALKNIASLAEKSKQIVNIASKIPMKATTSSAMIAQGTLFSSSLYEDAYDEGIKKGLSIEKAREVASLAGKDGYVLGAFTAPLSTQTIAMEGIFGKNVSNQIAKEVIDKYIEGGIQGTKNVLNKWLNKSSMYIREGGKEAIQENVQQGGQAFVVAPDVNELAGKEIIKDTISGDEFWSTTAISLTAGALMPFAGDVVSKVKSKVLKTTAIDAIDKLKGYQLLSQDIDKTTDLLNSQVAKGMYTEEQVSKLLNDLNLYRENINSIPGDLSAETAISLLNDLNSIKEKEAQKGKLEGAKDKILENEIQEIKNNIIKKVEEDAIQERKTKKVDVGEPAQVSEEVGERVPTEEAAEPTPIEEEVPVEKVAEVTPEEKVEEPTLVAEQEQVREEIVFPYKPKRAKVDVNIVDGKVQSINKKNTKQPASRSQKSIAEKDVLTNIIDVNAGKKVEIPADATPQDIPGLIFTDSENVREIAEAIDTEKKRLKESKTKGRDVSGGIYDILNLKFTPESWRNVTGLSSADSKVQFWISNNGVSIEDGWQEQIGAEAAAQLSTDQIVDFIETYNTAAKVAEFKQGDPEIASTIRDLETKFKDLTGTSPTPTNIKTVINIDPNRPPLKLIEEQVAEQEAMQIAEGEIETFGKKKAPSAKKLLGIKKKEITINEATALKNQIRLEARAAREATKELNKAREDIRTRIKEIEGAGKLTRAQANFIINKISKVNLRNPAAVDNALIAIDKVIKRADYIEKINIAKKKTKAVKKNLKGKIGIASAVRPSINQIASINPELIPDSVFNTYLDLIDMFSKRQTVLELKDINATAQETKQILDALNEELSQVPELTQRIYDSENKIEEDGVLDLNKTLDKMIEAEEITKEEADIVKKYKDQVLPPTETAEVSEEDIQKEKEALVEEIQSADKLKTQELPSRDERDLAKEFERVIKTEAINELENNELNNILKTIDNINNGYLPHYAEIMVEKINSINNAKVLGESISKAKPLKVSEAYSKAKAFLTKRTGLIELVRRNPLYYIDNVFGDFKSKDIYNSLFSKVAQGYSNFETETKRIEEKINDLENKIEESFNFDGNKKIESSYKRTAYKKQKEFESNEGSKEVKPAKDYIEATINAIKKGKTTYSMKGEGKMLQDILDNYTDAEGNIDADKLYNSFNKEEKAYLDEIDKLNNELEPKALYTSGVIRGDVITPLADYLHSNVLAESTPGKIKGVSDLANQYNQSLNPSTKAKNLIERTGKVNPIDFNISNSFLRGAKFTLMDYHLTKPIRTGRRTLANLEKKQDAEGAKQKDIDILNAIDFAYNESIENVLSSSYLELTFVDSVLEYLKRQGYRTILASLPRAAQELTSNIGFAAVYAPGDFTEGTKYKNIMMDAMGPEVMLNVKSSQTTRVYPSETLTGKFVDSSILDQYSFEPGTKVKSPWINAFRKYWYKGAGKLPFLGRVSGPRAMKSVELTADVLISSPDKIITRPLWFGSFANEFKKQSGKDVDYKKIANNDEAYINDNKDAIEKATDYADQQTVLAGSTRNPFMGYLKGTSKPSKSGIRKFFNSFNNFLLSFQINEYAAARLGIMSAVGRGHLSKTQGAALLAAVITRMTVYSTLAGTLANTAFSLLGAGDEEDDDKSLLQKFGQGFASAMTGLVFGRDFGGAMRMPINFAIEEYLNKPVLDFLREGEYDPYKDAIQFNYIPTDKGFGFNLWYEVGKNMLAYYGPIAETADLMRKKFSEKPEEDIEARIRQEREIKQRIPLEIAGNFGMVPLYKDVRKMLLNDMYKSLRVEKRNAAIQAKIKKEKLRGFKDEKEMKERAPDLWYNTFGPGAPDYSIKQIEKDIQKKIKEIEKQIKDLGY